MASKVAEIRTQVRDLLGREDWIYLLSLLLPLFLYNVSLKVARILTQLEVPGPLGFLDQLRSDVLFNLGYAVLWIGLFALARRGVGRAMVLALFHLSAILVALITTSAHSFYSTTGSILDWSYLLVFFS
ncbi:MAG: sulfatase, partial [Actinomycetota bacterium]